MLLLVVALLLGGGLWWVGTRGDDAPDRPAAPSGLAFYEADAETVAAGRHGTLIWSRKVSSGPTVGGETHLVLYRSVGAKGEPVAVSGVVSIPTGEAPEGGWPIISWAHGTTGLADLCAPSRGSLPGQTGIYGSVMDDFVASYLERGYAVLRTDYEGLGTPGPHPYLLGESAGRAVTDIVLAARELSPDLSSRWVAAGHSQGGQAALFASRSTDGYGSGLQLEGVIALAPPSQLGTVIGMSSSGKVGSTAFLGPLVHSAARVAGVEPASILTERAMAVVPHLEDRCITELSAADSFGGLGERGLLRPRADLARIESVVEGNDASAVRPGVPVLLVHGTKDELVPILLSDNLSTQYRSGGVDLDYRKVPAATHVGVLEAARPQVDEWLAGQLPPGR